MEIKEFCGNPITILAKHMSRDRERNKERGPIKI